MEHFGSHSDFSQLANAWPWLIVRVSYYLPSTRNRIKQTVVVVAGVKIWRRKTRRREQKDSPKLEVLSAFRFGLKKLSESGKYWIHKVEWTERKTWNEKTFSQSRVVAAPRVPQHSYSMSSLKRFTMITTYLLFSIIILTYLLLSITILSIIILSIIILNWPPGQVSWVSGSGTRSTSCLITVLPRKKWKQVNMMKVKVKVGASNPDWESKSENW